MSAAATPTGHTVLIRCVLQQKDVSVDCPPDWRILDLKHHLAKTIDDKPPANKQRLIYFGHCLKDTDKVAVVLRDLPDAQEHHVMHLAYTPSDQQLRAQTLTQQLRQRHTAPSNVTSDSEPAVNPINNTNMMGSNAPSYLFAPTQTDPSMQMWHQYNSYMTNYMQYMQQVYQQNGMANSEQWTQQIQQQQNHFFHNHNMNWFNQQAAHPNPANMMQHNNNMNGNNNNDANGFVPDAAVNLQAPAGQGAGGNLMAAAAAGGVQDEELVVRDWLDMSYLMLRAALMLMLLWFYSSVERFLVVTLVSVFVYLAQAGWFGRRHVANQQAAANQPANQVAVEGNPPEPVVNANEAQPEVAVAGAQPGSPQAPNVVPETPAFVIFYQTCYAFITGFFTSLIPDPAPPLDLN